MIIATIGHQEFMIDSISDAEELMKILSKAKAIEKQWAPKLRHYFTESKSERSISIEICNYPFFTEEQHLEAQTKSQSEEGK